MSSEKHGSGRHRGAGPSHTSLVATLWRRPAHRSTLKGLGLAATAIGVATAFATPPSTPGYQLTAEERTPARAVASAAAAPHSVDQFGVIGFSAQALPKPKATAAPDLTPRKTSERVPARVSRGANYSRAGLGAHSGMSANAVAVVNEIHASFPQISTIGGYRAGDPGDHGSGHAVDIMCSTSQGDAVAAHLQGMASTLNIKYLIWKQRIWYPGGSWKPMEDRGSPTQNHMDHVHVSVD
ncbi:hypothetical protein [Phycicoccus sp. Root101]|uniref:hypothetical protein n=1 Tax=Phycicoccus sp. Root101 TaxID=1736421 RepID=UPI0007031076|nr:hypothetical protein [Phycicoccus sp. Root101]KQU69183.1 hypothetical protein ASC58_04505 [Phycicoccus sp. Root101]